MGRKKIREEKSKLWGTKHALKSLNQAAHSDAHQNATHGSPGGTTTTGVTKWQGSVT
jgi:hypothetical protein